MLSILKKHLVKKKISKLFHTSQEGGGSCASELQFNLFNPSLIVTSFPMQSNLCKSRPEIFHLFKPLEGSAPYGGLFLAPAEG